MDKTIYFIRHGESISNAGGITMENKKVPLSAKGFEQAQTIAKSFTVKPSQILVSEYLRTHQTAEPFCGRNKSEYKVCTELNEFSIISHELIEGMTGTQRQPISDSLWTAGDVNKRMGAYSSENSHQFQFDPATFSSLKTTSNYISKWPLISIHCCH